MYNKDLKKRIIEISYKYKLSHIGSCISAVDIIDEIYSKKKKNEKFVLSQGHAGLALYCVMEKYDKSIDAEKLLVDGGIHPDRLTQPVDCSTGSLGHGLPIALGMALADRSKNVYCLISDGELTEGSIYESINFIRKYNITNIKIYINHNGYSAYDSTSYINSMSFSDVADIRFTSVKTDFLPFKDLEGHYHTINDEEYKLIMSTLL